MGTRTIVLAGVFAGLFCAASPGIAAAPAPADARQEDAMTQHATGTFEVKMQPQGEADAVPGRMSLDKRYGGDLVGTGQGEMLSAMTATPGSAVYVAIERVTGTLQGRKGGFLLVHKGVMDRGERSLVIEIVPDSGSGELQGIAGRCDIRIEDGRHYYDLDYTLPQ